MIKLLSVLSNIKIETGRLFSPDGTEFRGFKVTIGGITDPSEIERTYADIENILGRNKVPFKTHEETTPSGTFRSYSIST